ncbi:MAG: hypothetical protein U0359_23920 [Byssovorax sp.]
MAARKTTAKKSPARRAAPAPLAPGLHAGTIELRAEGTYGVRLLDGSFVSATLDDDVAPDFARECLRRGRRVIVTQGREGPVVLGALQTERSLTREEDGSLSVTAKKIRLKAEQSIVFETGQAALRLSPEGMLKLEGDKMVIDVGGLVRFLSARVEFP